jgi:hypothetical protein
MALRNGFGLKDRILISIIERFISSLFRVLERWEGRRGGKRRWFLAVNRTKVDSSYGSNCRLAVDCNHEVKRGFWSVIV